MRFLWLSFMLLLTAVTIQAQTPVYNFEQFEQRIQHANDTLYVVNFWATWCKPCVEELPFYQAAANTFSAKPVKFILASQDAKARTQQVAEFLHKNNYSSECFILSAGNPNSWIDQIDTSWSGLIPMTVIYRQKKKVYFYEGDFKSSEDLEKIIHSKL